MAETFVVFLLAAFLAELAGTITGFGTTTILVPLSAFFIPIKNAIVLVGLFHFFGTFWRALFFIKGINLRIALLFGIPSLVFSGIGASLLPGVDAVFLTKLLGLLLIIYALYSLFKSRLILPQNLLLLITGGGFVGFLAGLIGTAGTLRGAFLTSWKLPKEVYLGTGAAMGIGADFVRVVVYQRSGLLQFNFNIAVVLAATAFIGTFLGARIVKVTKEGVFTRVIFATLVLAGFRFLLA